jgi:hypothetical protein
LPALASHPGSGAIKIRHEEKPSTHRLLNSLMKPITMPHTNSFRCMPAQMGKMTMTNFMKGAAVAAALCCAPVWHATAQDVAVQDAPPANRNDFANPMDFGAVGDGKSHDTAALQRAIDYCASQGGGTVYCPPGHTFLIGTIELKSNVTLHVEGGAALMGSDQLSEYRQDTGEGPYYPEAVKGEMIYAHKAHNIRLTGMGTIDGGCVAKVKYVKHGAALVAPDGTRTTMRPMAIHFKECERIRIDNLCFANSRSWFTYLQYSKDISINGVTVDNKYQDGFNIESCEDVRITNCTLDCGDDAFAFTTSDPRRPVRNVTVSNCVARTHWSGMRIGPLSKGDFENILFSNVVFHGCGGGGFKIDPEEGGEVRNCQFTNIRMDQVAAPICILTAQWRDIGSTSKEIRIMPPSKIRNLLFSNMIIDAVGRCNPMPDNNSTIFIHGHKDAVIEGIVLDNITVTFPGCGTAAQAARRDMPDSHEIPWNKYGYWHSHKNRWGVPPAYGLYARHVDGLQVRNVTFRLARPDARPAIFWNQCRDCSVSGARIAISPEAGCLAVAKDCERVQLDRVRSEGKVETLLLLENTDPASAAVSAPDPFSGHRKAIAP